MPQLVGTNCAICRARISNELDARFCRECGHPRHDACARPPEQPTGAHCRECGMTVDPAAKSSQPKVPPRPVSRPQGPIPVAKVCPKCGGEKYTRVRPSGWVAFTWDRACKQCNTRYTPPTPMWAGWVFILAGLPLAGLGVVSILLRIAQGNVLGLPAMVCEGFLALLGCLAIFHGIRALSNPGKV
jgi:hypothetical protein